MRRSAAVVAALVAAGALAPAAGAAAPWLLIVSGEPLDRLVYLADWGENLRLYTDVVSTDAVVDETELVDRPVLKITQFWGNQGRDRPLHELGPDDGDVQYGRFYPAVGDAPAAIRLPLAEHPEAVRASARTLEILARAGVPTRVAAPVDETPWRAIAAAPIALAAVALAIAAVRRRATTVRARSADVAH